MHVSSLVSSSNLPAEKKKEKNTYLFFLSVKKMSASKMKMRERKLKNQPVSVQYPSSSTNSGGSGILIIITNVIFFFLIDSVTRGWRKAIRVRWLYRWRDTFLLYLWFRWSWWCWPIWHAHICRKTKNCTPVGWMGPRTSKRWRRLYQRDAQMHHR